MIGKTVTIKSENLRFEVKVLDTKNSYGRKRYLVTPIAGKGRVWIENIIINNE